MLYVRKLNDERSAFFFFRMYGNLSFVQMYYLLRKSHAYAMSFGYLLLFATIKQFKRCCLSLSDIPIPSSEQRTTALLSQ